LRADTRHLHQIGHVLPCLPTSTATAIATGFLPAVGTVFWFQGELFQGTHGEDVTEAAVSAAFAVADALRSGVLGPRRGSGVGIVVGACECRFCHGAVMSVQLADDGSQIRDGGRDQRIVDLSLREGDVKAFVEREVRCQVVVVESV